MNHAASSLLAVDQVAGVLGVHLRTVRRYLRVDTVYEPARARLKLIEASAAQPH
jgi:hypothetical protein